jgi:hypothetical protein
MGGTRDWFGQCPTIRVTENSFQLTGSGEPELCGFLALGQSNVFSFFAFPFLRLCKGGVLLILNRDNEGLHKIIIHIGELLVIDNRQ